MRTQNVGRKGLGKIAAYAVIKAREEGVGDPMEGTRLIKAFLKISDPSVRSALIQLVEQFAAALTNRS